MTPELIKEIIVGSVAAFATAVCTGIPAALLFWWTWQRDQERVIVQKLIPNWSTLAGERVPEKDGFGPVCNILIRNRSFFSVYVSAVGFLIDGEVIELEHPYFPLKMKANPDPNSNRPNIADDDSDPQEIPSQKLLMIDVYEDSDRAKIGESLMKAAKRHKTSAEKILISPRVAAIVALQSRKEFTSETLRRRIWRRAKRRLMRWRRRGGRS